MTIGPNPYQGKADANAAGHSVPGDVTRNEALLHDAGIAERGMHMPGWAWLVVIAVVAVVAVIVAAY